MREIKVGEMRGKDNGGRQVVGYEPQESCLHVPSNVGNLRSAENSQFHTSLAQIGLF